MFYEKKEILPVIESIIKYARTGDYSSASSQINQFLLLLQAKLSAGKLNAASLSKISYSLETIIEMQKMGNWVAVADVLEFEFIDLIRKELV